MCGICGIVYRDHDRPVDAQQLIEMRDTMQWRGPDDAGYYLAPGVGLGARRLAIFDTSQRGHMPMWTPGGRYWIVFNGAVYNFPELRAELMGRGWQFRSDTDTEVLLYLYAEEGPAMLERLNGMYALAIWDARERTLFLARDHAGIKPLYYTDDGECLRFASEEKALFAGGVERRFDEEVWPELLAFRYVAGERTPFIGVKRLLPGHYLLWRRGRAQITRYWNLAERARAWREALPAQPSEWLRETFDDAVMLRRLSDVPLGVLLSGGLDSSSIAASLASQSLETGVASFTVRFNERRYDEGPLAREVAAHCQLTPYELQITPAEMPALLQRAAWLNDEPLAHASDLHLYAVSAYAKERVTVLLSGEGADEMLGGYVRYHPLRHASLLRAARPLLLLPGLLPLLDSSPRARKLRRFLELGSLDRHVLFNACETLPDELRLLVSGLYESFTYRKQVLEEARALYPGDYARQAMYADQHTYLCSLLDRNDRMTMGASIECRVPFLDRRLLVMSAALPSSVIFAGRRGKSLLRTAVGARLPAPVLRHPKWGFGVPWSQYLKKIPEFRQRLEAMHTLPPLSDGFFDGRKLAALVNDFLGGEPRHEELVRQLFLLSIWHCATESQATTGATSTSEQPVAPPPPLWPVSPAASTLAVSDGLRLQK